MENVTRKSQLKFLSKERIHPEITRENIVQELNWMMMDKVGDVKVGTFYDLAKCSDKEFWDNPKVKMLLEYRASLLCPVIDVIPNENLAYLETLADEYGDTHHFCQHCGKMIFTVRGAGGNWTDECAGVFGDSYELCGECGKRFFSEELTSA